MLKHRTNAKRGVVEDPRARRSRNGNGGANATTARQQWTVAASNRCGDERRWSFEAKGCVALE